MPSTLVNFLGAPGVGKSTSSAYIYSRLKSIPINCEEVKEYIKLWTYDGRKNDDYSQIYIMAQQIRAESLLLNKVEYICTDSPVLLSMYYSRFSPPVLRDNINSMVKAYYKQLNLDGHKVVNIFLNRSKPYLAVGRWQTAEESDIMHNEIYNMLTDLDVDFYMYDTDRESLDVLYFQLLNNVL